MAVKLCRPNGHKIYRIFHSKALQNFCPNWDFWFENICHLAALHLSSIFVTKLQGNPCRVNEKNVPALGGLVVL
jgi:hypothetical protein